MLASEEFEDILSFSLEYCSDTMSDAAVVAPTGPESLKSPPTDSNGPPETTQQQQHEIKDPLTSKEHQTDPPNIDSNSHSNPLGNGVVNDGDSQCSSQGIEENGVLSELSSESLPGSPLLPSSPESGGPGDGGSTTDGTAEKPKSLNLEKKTPRFNIEKVKSPTPSSEHPSLNQQNRWVPFHMFQKVGEL